MGTFQALTEVTHPEIHTNNCLLISDNFNIVKFANTPNLQDSNEKLWLLKHEIGTQAAWLDEIGPNRCNRLLLVAFIFTIRTVLKPMDFTGLQDMLAVESDEKAL